VNLFRNISRLAMIGVTALPIPGSSSHELGTHELPAIEQPVVMFITTPSRMPLDEAMKSFNDPRYPATAFVANRVLSRSLDISVMRVADGQLVRDGASRNLASDGIESLFDVAVRAKEADPRRTVCEVFGRDQQHRPVALAVSQSYDPYEAMALTETVRDRLTQLDFKGYQLGATVCII